MPSKVQTYTAVLLSFSIFSAGVKVSAEDNIPACAPASYDDAACVSAHENGAGDINRNDLGNHAWVAGDKRAAFIHWRDGAINGNDPGAMHNYAASLQNGDGAPKDLPEAVKWFQKAADAGMAESMFALGNLYYTGNVSEQNFIRAAELWRKGAEAGHVPSQTNYGYVLFVGEGVEPNYAEAERWTRKAVAAGEPNAKATLGEMYEFGRGVPIDFTEAEKWYREADAEGVKDAKDGLARIEQIKQTQRAEIEKRKAALADKLAAISESIAPGQTAADRAALSRQIDNDAKLQQIHASAAAGDFNDQVRLGLIYSGILNFPGDGETARKWMQRAIDQKTEAVEKKLVNVVMMLAVSFRDGTLPEAEGKSSRVPAHEIVINYIESVKWFELAAELGGKNALFAIGDLYQNGGHGLRQDDAAAMRYYQRAAAIDVSPALALRLGEGFDAGRGVKKNRDTAAHWFKQAQAHYTAPKEWLVKYYLDKDDLTSSIYWIDKQAKLPFKDAAESESFFAVTRQVYAKLLPPAPKGWDAQPVTFGIDKEVVWAMHLAGDDAVYRIQFGRSYKERTSGREMSVVVSVNNFAQSDKHLKTGAHARKTADKAREKMASTNESHAAEIADAMKFYTRFGDYDGLFIVGDENAVASALVPINSHISVTAGFQSTRASPTDKDKDVTDLKSLLRAMDFDRLKDAVARHGYYKKSASGIIHLP